MQQATIILETISAYLEASIPPPAMVALISVSSSSSPLMASCKWRGVILFTLRSLEQFPANSSTYVYIGERRHGTHGVVIINTGSAKYVRYAVYN